MTEGLPSTVSTDNEDYIPPMPPPSATQCKHYMPLSHGCDDCTIERLVSERDALAVRVRELEANARRYVWIRTHTGGESDRRGRQSFILPDPHPLGNILKGSVAQHLDAAIDAALTTPESKP